MADRPLYEESALRALEHLHIRMAETSKDSNTFAARFHYGGLIAVAAILNADVVLLKTQVSPGLRMGLVAMTGLLLLALSIWYFGLIADYRVEQDRNYRKTKHKYEVMLYGLMYHASAYELIRELEQPAKQRSTGSAPAPPFGTFSEAAIYLHDHHGSRLVDLKKREWAWLEALYVVVVVFVIRVIWAFAPAL